MKRGREENGQTSAEKKTKGAHRVLLLGCGLVAPPLIHYLVGHGIHLTIASRTVNKTREVVKGLDEKLVEAVELDVESSGAWDQLDALTQKTDLVISLLPYIHHVQAAKIALKYKKHFTTTSYTSDEMAALDEEGKKAGITILNECGVDPGLDHMSAQKVIDEVHSKGGKVLSFTSICGGLPAPQDNDNPFGYKLSWSPRGVLLASRNNATFLLHGEKIHVLGKDLYDSKVYKVEEVEGQTLEWYPNRDSTKYIDIYSIPEVKTIIRGTYRNKGWCNVMRVLSSYGFTSTDPLGSEFVGKSFANFTLGLFRGSTVKSKDAKSVVAEVVGVSQTDPIISKMEWIGLFNNELTVPQGTATPLDAVCYLFQRLLVYAPGQKDMLVMRHTFQVEYTKAKRETITSTMLDFGLQPKSFSSMARTVSLPVAAAIRAILDGRLKTRGVLRPVQPEVYNLILDEMKVENITFTEKVLPTHFWLRHETKPGEERVPVTPKDVAKLKAAGFQVTVERSSTRCFPDDDYAKAGGELVEGGSWKTAPYPAIILGLKELPEEKDALVHRHIYFAHCYKNQGGWKEILQRFQEGGGLLWDLEFLVDDNKRRVAAFGRPAGVVGMALGLLQWVQQRIAKSPISDLKSWKSTTDMVKTVQEALKKVSSPPTVLVLGAKGRCGGGAVWFAEQCGIKATQWDLEETKGGGPFAQLLQHDVLVNAIYLSEKIPPFITHESIKSTPDRKLSVFVDVSCDTSNPNNPFPIYDRGTTLVEPVLNVVSGAVGTSSLPLDVIAIDHLPSLTPADSSMAFSADILPHLLLLKNPDAPVWKRAEELFHQKVASIKS